MDAKKSNPIKGFLYISVWVIIWGTLGSFIDYHQAAAYTVHGTFGIKVWIYEK